MATDDPQMIIQTAGSPSSRNRTCKVICNQCDFCCGHWGIVRNFDPSDAYTGVTVFNTNPLFGDRPKVVCVEVVSRGGVAVLWLRNIGCLKELHVLRNLSISQCRIRAQNFTIAHPINNVRLSHAPAFRKLIHSNTHSVAKGRKRQKLRTNGKERPPTIFLCCLDSRRSIYAAHKKLSPNWPYGAHRHNIQLELMPQIFWLVKCRCVIA